MFKYGIIKLYEDMGRQVKTGLDYFPFDVAFFTELKVRKLIKYQGGRSISIYACLLCNIYENGYYMLWDNEIPFLVSEKTGFEEGYIKEVINCCLSVGLFDKNLYDKCKVITSKGIQKRYHEICKISKRKNQINEFSLINSEETIVYSEEIGINSEEIHINSGKSAQSKGKERKVNESKVNTPIVPRGEKNENFQNQFEEQGKIIWNSPEIKEKSCGKKEKEVVDSFHEQCVRLPKIQAISKQRKSAINARINDYSLEKVKEVFKKAGESNFLSGENKSDWKADFDWILKPTNFLKVLEGNYDNKKLNDGQSNNNTNSGNNSGYGNTTNSKGGKVSASSILARQAREQSSGNGNSGNFTYEAEVVP